MPTETTNIAPPLAKDIKSFAVLKNKKECLWIKVQMCYNLITELPKKLESFKLRTSELESIKIDYYNVLDKLSLLSATHPDFYVNTVQLTTAFDELYFEILIALGTPLTPTTQSVSTTPPTVARTHFPEIHIAKFNGSYEKFPAFIALYNSLIHNANLTPIEKFSYLLGYVEGSALNLIQTVTFSPDNYDIAYQLLIDRYSSKRRIANHHLSTILKLPPLKSDSPNAIRDLVDSLQANVTSLNSLKIKDLADYILLEISLRLLDSKTRKDFETQHLKQEFPRFENLIKFLRSCCSVAELVTPSSTSQTKINSDSHNKISERRRAYMTVQDSQIYNISCPHCKDQHKLIKCPSFLASSPKARYEIAKKLKRCYACLGTHNISNCSSKNCCKSCGNKNHNTLLHFENNLVNKSQTDTPQARETSSHNLSRSDITSASVSLVNSKVPCQDSIAILGTAQARILDFFGKWHSCRLVIDSGSQVNFITTRLANRLGLARSKCPYSLKGIGQTSLGRAQGLVNCKLAPANSFETIVNFEAVVIPRVTGDLPATNLSQSLRDRFSNLNLADPHFHCRSEIDILLGVDSVLDITPSQPAHIKGNPSAILTTLGWVIMGSASQSESNSQIPINSMFGNIEYTHSLNDTLRSFWESEEIASTPHTSPEDDFCESYFQETVLRTETGRYITRLPFKNGLRPTLGSNREHAINRLLKLEVRFNRDPQFFELYRNNIEDYISQGHLVPATRTVPYILTHHGVMKSHSSGLSIRVVFNPAEKDSNSISLNDTLLSGPKLQSDIGQVITRFRIPQIALTCDIKQMFRAISLHPDDCQYQHIFWRVSPDEPIREWEHTRVIFGATCSPFLAQRTIQKLIEDDGSRFPLAANTLNYGIHVDDILCGGDDELSTLELRKQLVELLHLGGFELGKWASSNNSMVDFNNTTSQKLPSSSSSIKVLGLSWDPTRDVFHYFLSPFKEIPSKRGILSRIARTYDVNGYLSPFVFSLKVLLQRLWLDNVDWDDALPPDISRQWSRILEELHFIEKISIPRCIICLNWLNANLIGFSDASSIGMAAVIYLRLELEGSVHLNLVIAKSRVAPLKPWTIPRLELGAACLLAKLLRQITPSFSSLKLGSPICFTDSTTTLAWIRTPPHLLKTFVANRVAQIHENKGDAVWKHVPGTLNPADPASRGLLPSELLNCKLWWHGPDFLYGSVDSWPNESFDNQAVVLELKDIKISSHLSTLDSTPFDELLDRVSSLTKLQRILAYILRFVRNLKDKGTRDSTSLIPPLSTKEYKDALDLSIKITQPRHLASDVKLLSDGNLCSRKYRKLSPFLNPHGFVMVGGRLKHSKLPRNSRHPILIPSKSRLATLLVDHFHFFSCHGGPQLVQSLIQRNYWIPSARNLIRQRIFRCLVCYRFKAQPVQPPMADLPSYRVEPSRTFSHTGIDFAGPFNLKASALRTNRTIKCYLALFVCMVTKALHLEAVTSLSTEGCLAALDRFIARRGLPNRIYSDQGRNFRGAAREINEITKFMQSSNEAIAHYLATRQIEWCFNPPYAPNFGGLWEAGVKSFKFHFRRVVGDQVLSLEEFITVIARIEGILNSRPLCEVSNAPEDGVDYLTPGHFLIGGPILSRPEPDILDLKTNTLNRWQLIRQLIQSFWQRWSKEYLHSQIFRPKWTSNPQPLSEGDLVFWYSPGMPPTQWPKGRISQLIAGPDGVARTVLIKTTTGEVLRPVNKVVPLPRD